MTPTDSQQTSAGSAFCSVEHHDHGDGIFSIRVADTEGNNTLSQDLIGRLLRAIEAVRGAASLKVLMLEGTRDCFLSGDRTHYNEAVARELYESIASLPVPVIAVMQGDAIGTGFLVGALCDFMVCSQTACYGYADPDAGLFPTWEEDRLFSRRFGQIRATELLYQATRATGQQLREKGWSCPILPPEHVEEYALSLASNLARKSQDSLRLLKQHLARPMLQLTKALAPVVPSPDGSQGDRGESDRRIISPSEHIKLTVHAEKVLVARICATGEEYETKVLAADLTALFAQLRERQADCTATYRSIVLVSEHLEFLPEPEARLSVDSVLSLQRVLLRAPLPVIAVLNSNTSGSAWLVAQFCDATVYRREGTYCAASLLRSSQLARLAAMIFSRRFGSAPGRAILLTGATCSGVELRQRVGPVPLAAQDQVPVEALTLAEYWTKWPLDAVVSWKKQATLDIREAIGRLPPWLAEETASVEVSADRTLVDAPVPIALESGVITATAHPEGILVVRMEDRDAKNMFSDEFIRGMWEVFTHVEATSDYKVVVLTGYDKYFASGGTKEALLAIQEGKLKFTDDQTYQLAFACKVPVIAAMQGHAIGAGLSLGLFADLTLLSEESKYVSPYMSYGFTPGVAATLIVPEIFGHDLARETLLTAQECGGSELQDRGVSLPVYPRKQVLEAAMQVARQIARHSRNSLVHIKQQLNGPVHDKLPECCEQELAMHELTFVGQAETLKQIQTVFDQMDSQPKPDQPGPDSAENATSVPSDTPPARVATTTPAPAATPAAATRATTTRAADTEPLPEVIASLKQLLARELHLAEQELDENTQFMDLGLDSITGVTWIRRVNEQYGLSLLATIVYSHPTLTKLGRHVKEEADKLGAGELEQTDPSEPDRKVPVAAAALPGNSIEARSAFRELVSWRRNEPARIEPVTSPEPVTTQEPATSPVRSPQPIAVIGLAGQFPQARNLAQYWRNIAEGRSCISQIPSSRWDIDACFQEGEPAEGKTNCRYMGLLEDYDRFDPLFFNISPLEAKAMDPQQRLFLQACWHSIEHAGYNPKSLAGSRCGVFAGCGAGEYGLLSRRVRLSAYGFTGAANAILSARIAYFLDLQGPCLSIDTACSSSLVAIASACDSLTSGVSDLALAGGVYVDAGPAMHIMTSQAGMLSTDGRCYTFDRRANGFVPGEAVGVVLLKRLEDAQRDHDIIHAVIQGWGVNQDGRTNGITAPNPESQARLQQDVYSRFKINPAEIQLIEAHGTGTTLGDPIEIEGLKKSFKPHTRKAGYCALGSVKSNIGHCLAAAGVSGLIKLVLALKHRQLPPTINFEQLNEHIGLDGSPFYVNTGLQDWVLNGASKRQAAVSSFGYSGTNAHLVVAEHLPVSAIRPSAAAAGGPKIIVPLSAKTAAQLKQTSRDLLDFIDGEGRSVDLAEIAYTLQVGREAMEERVGFLVGCLDQLAGKLEAFIAGRRDIADFYHGQVRLNREGMSLISEDEELKDTLIDRWISGKKPAKLLRLWVKGLEFDWNKLYGEVRPQRIALPTYPFAKERYWIDCSDDDGELAGPDVALREQDGDVRVQTGRLTLQHSPEVQGPIAAQEAAPEASQRLLFEEYWREQPLTEADAAMAAGGQSGRQTIVFSDGPLDEEPRGDVIFVQPASGYRQVSARAYECRRDDPQDIQRIVSEAAAGSNQPVSIVYLWAKGRQSAGIHSVFSLFKGVKASGDLVADVVLVGGGYDPASVASCWDHSWIGFERSLKLLLPSVRIALLYTDTSACTLAQLSDARQSGGVLWYQHDRRYVLSVRPTQAARQSAAPVIKQNGAYLITGGCGALGSTFARYLAQNYQARLVLVGRRPLSGAIQEQLDELVRAGAQEAHYAAVDIGNPQELTAWAQKLPFQLTGIVHAAGVESAGAFHERSTADIDRVLRPKTTGTLSLDEVLAHHPLDFICYFSSSAGMLGDFGSCDYAVANRFQMAYGHYRSHNPRLPGKAVVINWPLWKKEAGREGGMGSHQPERADFYLKSSGQDALEGTQGVEIWDDIMQAGQPQTLVAVGKPTRIERFLHRIYQTGRPVQADTTPGSSSSARGTRWKPQYQDLSLPERVRLEVRQLVSTALGLEPQRLDDTANLADYGFDSISLAAFAKRLTGHFAVEVTPALFFNYSTVQQLVDYFVGEHRVQMEQLYNPPQTDGAQDIPSDAKVAPFANEAGAPTSKAPAHHGLSHDEPQTIAKQDSGAGRNREPIAIIGMSGRFPQANNVDQLWSLLAQARSGLTEVPSSRWNWRDYFTAPGHPRNRMSTNMGGFIEGADEFDPLFFEISPREAQEMDPAERVLLMEAYHAIEDARLSPASLRGSNVGVFVGMEEGQYSQIADQGVTTGGAAMISSRLSYFLDLHGPTIATNTACSSGLVALHQAAMSLRQGECESALVAAVALSLAPQAWVKMSAAGMLSEEGQCYSFSNKANGIGIGEAVVVLMLKPLSAALANGDHIYGLIKASGINFDGKTNGVTAPNGRMQAKLIEDIYTSYGIDVADISHIVAHGTGTKLGDPVELNALNEAFRKLGERREPVGRRAQCAVTSCKTNLGHTMAASGLVSLVGLLKGLQHRQIPASLYCEEENEYITWRDSPFHINKSTRAWQAADGRPLMGAVSAFGRSGTNAHVVIEEYRLAVVAERRTFATSPGPRVLVPLSARTAEQLAQKARDLLDFIAEPVDLVSLAYTLQVAREPMSERVAFIADSVEQLAGKLNAYLRSEPHVEEVIHGSVGSRNDGIGIISRDDDMKEAIGKWIAGNKLSKLAHLWVSGMELDWRGLYAQIQPKPERIGVPTYPFARERYWIEGRAPDRQTDIKAVADREPESTRRLESIEDIIDQLDGGSIKSAQAVAYLKKVV